MKKSILITLLIPSICFAGSFQEREANKKAAEALNGRPNVYIKGGRIDVLTRDRAIEIADPKRPEKTVDRAVEGALKSKREGAIGIIKDDSSTGRMRKRQIERELRKRGLDDDIEVIEIDPEDEE